MITEDYVSFETSKLLKEKGFNEKCYVNYSSNGITLHFNYQTPSDGIPCPTLQMAMKWLRKVHNINIEVFYFDPDNKTRWAFEIIRLPSGACVFGEYNKYSYEEACEAGIKHCLEKLI